MKLLWKMFLTFFKIGLFTIGGGYAMVPLIQQEIVDKNQWISSEEFLELLALAQSAPGPIAVNTAVFVGYKIKGLIGVLATTLGCILPSFLIILLIAMYIRDFKKYDRVEAAFKALRPAVIALILIPAINNAKKLPQNFLQYGIIAASTIAILCFGISPIYVIIVGGLLGLTLGLLKKEGAPKVEGAKE